MNNELNNETNTNINTNVEPVVTPVMSEVVTEPVVQTDSNTINPDLNAGAGDKDAYVDEKLKSVEVNEYTPPSKGTIRLMIFFFIFLIVFVLFLPNIQESIDKKLFGGTQKIEEITDGKLICELKDNTVNLDREIERIFYYNDNKLQSATFTTTTKGDPSEDEETLNELADKCSLIKSNTDSLSGIDINCTYSQGKVVEVEKFEFKYYKSEEVQPIYAEAGGDILEYKLDQDIDKIMINMRSGGFTCHKEK